MADVIINGRKLSDFHANMLEYSVSDCSHTDGYLLPPGRMIPEKIKSRIGLRKVTMTLDFEGANLSVITAYISELTETLRKEANLQLPDGFFYWCEYDKASTPKIKAPWIMQVKFSLTGFRHSGMRTINLHASGTVNIEGNCETPIHVTVTRDNPGVTEFTIFGIVVKNVTGTVTIDGIHTTITDQNGKNKFRDAPSMTSWPSLQPGNNRVELSAGIKAVLRYYPIIQ